MTNRGIERRQGKTLDGSIAKWPICCIAFPLWIVIAGCTHSHVIQVTVTNASAEKVSTITIDYPEATFGINALEPGKSFRYKIKPTATGALKIEFRDVQGRHHVSSGPVVHKNDEGSIIVNLTQSDATADLRLQ